jgi:sortase A
VRNGDRIVVKTVDGEYAYEVREMRVVPPNDVSVLAPTAEPVLTLVTCYPFDYIGSAPKRFIVRAVISKEEGRRRKEEGRREKAASLLSPS